jgi:hypothetical protein
MSTALAFISVYIAGLDLLFDKDNSQFFRLKVFNRVKHSQAACVFAGALRL